jgi:hypothetical protein
MASHAQEQQHPQEKPDRELVNHLLGSEPEDFNLVEYARLRIRYQGFPGARDIQRDLERILQKWQLTETALFEKTRLIHAKGQAYQRRSGEDQQDWS